MSRYLIISYYYTPMVSARAFRWHNIAKEWHKQGHQVDVICAWLPGLPKHENIDGINIYRGNVEWFEKLRAQFIRKSSVGNNNNTIQQTPTRKSILKRILKPILLWVYNNIYSRLYWPDGAFLWYIPARKLVKTLIQTNNYDAIISVSLYFTSHLVGEFAHHKMPQVPWLVDMGDPFAPMDDETINNPLYQRLNMSTEKRILQKATAISVTTKGTKNLYALSMSEAIASKMTVIPPLLSTPLNTHALNKEA